MNLKVFSIVTVWFLLFSVGPVLGFSTHNVTISRTFDTVEAAVNDPITVTLTFTNLETNLQDNTMRGFYYTEQMPEGFSVNTDSVKINESDNSYTMESGSVGDVYAGYIPFRWILEIPPSFNENNPISTGSNVKIVYSITSAQEGTFNFDEFSWVGYYDSAPEGERAAFGNSEEIDKIMISFFGTDNDEGAVGGASCFIATAAYGSSMDWHVRTLSEFTDKRLLSNQLGRGLVKIYYNLSPPVAEYLPRHPTASAAVRYALIPITGTAYLALHVHPLILLFGFTCLLFGTILYFRRHHRSIF